MFLTRDIRKGAYMSDDPDAKAAEEQIEQGKEKLREAGKKQIEEGQEAVEKSEE